MADPTISKTSEDESYLVIRDGLISSDSALNDQRGTDLTPVYSEYDSSLSFIDTYTNGSYEVFLFQSNSSFKLIVLNPKRRFKMPFSGRQVFIRRRGGRSLLSSRPTRRYSSPSRRRRGPRSSSSVSAVCCRGG